MVGADGAVAPETWPRIRQPRLVLRRNRILPGPLKPLDRRSRRPAWAVGLGMVGLSLVATWAVASQIRTDATVADQADLVAAADPVSDPAPSVRIVGAAPVPQAAPASEPPAMLETSAPSRAPTADPQPVAAILPAQAVPAAKPAAKPSVEFGSLPVLDLDEAAFDAVRTPVSDVSSPMAPRGYGRP